MANEILKFLNGQSSNLASKTVKAGQVYFAINSDGETGSIYFDAPISSTVTKRIAMSGQSVEHANEADYATRDALGNIITDTYISQMRLDNSGTKIQYKYPGTQTWSELQPLFLPLAGGQITNDLGVNGTITAGNLIVNGAARFVQTILGNILSADKWSTARNFAISDATAAHIGTTVPVDGSAAVTLPLPATITATLKGNADTATKASQDANGKTISNEYLHRAANNSSTLNQFSGAPAYILGIEAFGDGGEVKWQSASSITVGKATTADTWTTARNFAISDDSGSNTGTAVSVKGNNNVTLPLPTQIYVTGNHMGFINGGETDKFFDFAYAANPTASTAPGASWRIGALNSGSSDTNYFVIQTGGSSTSSTTWNNALRIGMNTLDIHVGGNLNPVESNKKTLGTTTLKWANVYATKFTGDLVGNADTATKWKDARNFAISDSTAAHTGESRSVNGTSAVTLPLPATITASIIGHASEDLSLSGGTMTGDINLNNHYLKGENSYTNHAIFPGASGQDHQDFYEYGGVWNFYQSRSGTNTLLAKIDSTGIHANADSASKWVTARKFSISDSDAAHTGTQISVDGSQNYVLPLPATIKATLQGNADSATIARYVSCSDTRSTTIAPQDLTAAQGVQFNFKQNSVTGLTAAYAGVMSFRPYASASDWSGGPAHEIAFDANGIYHRKSTDSTTWGAWETIIHSGNIGNYTVNSADTWTTARNFSISDATAAHIGTAVSVDGSSAVTLPLPSTITATLKGNADTATNADKVDNWHMRYYGYKNTYTYNQPTANTVWYLRIKTANWNSDLERIELKAQGDNRTGQVVLFTGSRHSNWWGYASNYNFVGILGVYKNIDNADNIWLKIDSTCTKIDLYTTFDATITNESTTDSNYTSPPSSGGIFGNAATFTSFIGNADTTTKWKTARNFIISDATAAHTGTTVSVDGSAAVTLPLPATITADIIGNVSSATKTYVTIADTTKFYLIGSTNTSSGNADLKEDTGLYAGTTKGQLGAAYVGINGDNTNYRLYVNGTSLMTDTLKINIDTGNGSIGELEIGSKNSSWTHFTANRDFYFSRQASINGNVLPYTDLIYNLGADSRRWLNVYANILRLQGAASDPSTSAGARIEFAYDNGSNRSDPIYLAYTPNDSYRNVTGSAGLKLMKGTGVTTAWFEIDGPTYSNGTIYAKVTTDSSSTTTGSIVASGGVGIAKQLRVGGNTNLGGTLGVSGATTLASTLTVSGNTSLNGNLTVASNKTTTLGGTLTVSGIATFSNQVKVEKDTDSTRSLDGNASIVTDGGVSVAKQLSAKMIKIDNGQASEGCQLIYNETNNCLEFVFS